MKNLNKEQNDLLCGLMLGDGCIARRSKTANAYFVTNHKIEDRNYVWWIFNYLKDFCNNPPNTKTWFDGREGFNRFFEQETFATKCLPCFSSIYDRWYINGKKSIPFNFSEEELSDLTLLIWFLDDGSCYYPKKYPESLQIRLYTNGFSKDDVNKLRIFLSKKLKVMFTMGSDKKHPDQFVLIGSDRAARAYFKVIDNIAPIEMKRKYLWRNDICHFYDKLESKKSKSRNQSIFEREYSILELFYLKNKITISQIADYCNWKRNSKWNVNPTTQINRYLKCYEEKFLIEKTKEFIFHYGRVYKITEKGKEYFEASLKDKNINDLLFTYVPLAKSKHGPK